MSISQSRLSKLRRRVYLLIPEWIRKRDFELFTLLLCFTAGIPILTTGDVEATSFEAQLPFQVVQAWAASLVVSPLLVVLGAVMAHRSVGLKSFRWVRWEVFGLRLVSYAAYLYAAVIFINTLALGVPFPPAITFITILGLTSTLRAWGLLEQIENFWERMGVEQ